MAYLSTLDMAFAIILRIYSSLVGQDRNTQRGGFTFVLCMTESGTIGAIWNSLSVGMAVRIILITQGSRIR